MENKLWNNTTIEDKLWIDIEKNNTTVKDRLLLELDLVYNNDS